MKKQNKHLSFPIVVICLGILLSSLVSCTADPAFTETPGLNEDPESSVATNDTTNIPESSVVTNDTTNIPDTTGTPADTKGEPGVITIPDQTTKEEDIQTPATPSVMDPIFSVQGGVLNSSEQLALSIPDDAPEGAYIVYTTDGSEPEAQGTNKYESEIPVLSDTDCTVIRASIFDESGNQLGHTVTMTYFRAGISTLRVVSLVTDSENLYGESGIFANRLETGKESERPVSVEIFEPSGELLVRQDAAMRLSGAGSRNFDPANLRIVARKPETFVGSEFKYNGKGKFHAQLFSESECSAYDSFLLRNGGNDSLHQASKNFLRMNMLRDAIANNVCAQAETMLGGTVFAQLTTPVAVYLNGSYYGMLNMKQDFDENFIESAYDLPEEGVAMLKGKKEGKTMYYNIESGTEKDLSDWQELCAYCVENACSDNYANAYARVAEQLDLENFSRYYAVMLYLCNTDWPQNNTMIWRYTPTSGDNTEGMAYADGKWRAVIRDMDLCFALHDEASQSSSTTYTMADTDTFYRITVFYRDGEYVYDESLGLYDDTMGFQGLFDFLIRSEDFREMFVKACDALCSEKFAQMCRDEVERYYALTLPEMPAHIDLWKSNGEINRLYTIQHFKDAKNYMLEFIEDRPAYFKQYLNDALAYYD